MNPSTTRPRVLCNAAVAALLALDLLGAGTAGATPLLGSAQAFSVLAASTITNTGVTTLWGDLGLYPGTAITGQGSLLVAGTVHATDGVAQQAQADAALAYGALAGQAVTLDLTGQNLGGLTLTPGVYHFADAAQLTGTLVLDYQGRSDAVFVFQVFSALTVASQAVVRVTHPGLAGLNGPDGLFWQVGSSATLGTGSLFAGSLLADQSITLQTGASVRCGRAIALHGAVTLDNNLLSDDCPAAAVPGTPLPEPSSLALVTLALALGLAAAAAANKAATRAARRVSPPCKP